MRSFQQQDFASVLASSGIRPGDVVFVHSSLFQLGKPEDASIRDIPQLLYRQLRDRLGDEGTIAVPTFNFEFCRGETFDRQHTPSEGMGAFSEYIRTLPDSVRSPHPMQSMAAVGARADEIADRDTAGAFDDGSSFDALLDYDAHLLMVGCDINAVSLVHWAEQRAGVPYRFWKEFSGRYRDGDRIDRRTYRMYARDLQRDPEVLIYPVGRALRRCGELRRFRLGAGAVETCRARHFASAALQLLRRRPNALVRYPEPETPRRSHGS